MRATVITKLNHSEQELLVAIEESMLCGPSPTLRELARQLGMTFGGVRYNLLRLREKGLVAWEPRLARTLRVVRSVELAGTVRGEG